MIELTTDNQQYAVCQFIEQYGYAGPVEISRVGDDLVICNSFRSWRVTRYDEIEDDDSNEIIPGIDGDVDPMAQEARSRGLTAL